MASNNRRPGLAHRLFHSLVIGSVVLLEGAGCSVSHDPPPRPEPDSGGPQPDAGGRRPDAGGVDAGAPDAGAPDAGIPDAGPMDILRMCEEGWPTTKAFYCTTTDAGVTVCCDYVRPDAAEDCCVPRQP